VVLCVVIDGAAVGISNGRFRIDIGTTVAPGDVIAGIDRSLKFGKEGQCIIELNISYTPVDCADILLLIELTKRVADRLRVWHAAAGPLPPAVVLVKAGIAPDGLGGVHL